MADEITNLNNDRLQNAIQIPSDTIIDKELKSIFQRLETTEDLNDIVAMMDQIATLLSHQNSRIARKYIQMLLIEIERVVKIQAASYNSRAVQVLTVLGGVVQMAAGFGGACGIAAFQANATALKIVEGLMQGCNAGGTLSGSVGNLVDKYNQGPQEIRRHELSVRNMVKDQNQQYGNSAEGKESEYLRAKREKDNALHQIFTQMTGVNS